MQVIWHLVRKLGSMDYLFLFFGLCILLLGGKFLVDGASAFALKFGLSPGLIGLTIVAFGTSAPELLVSVNAALKGNSDIAVGNVIGSNISNISLVLGISALFYPIRIMKSVLKLDYVVVLVSSLLFYLLSLDGLISRVEGGILFILLIIVNFYFFRKVGTYVSDEDEKIVVLPLWKSLLFLLVGILGLYFGSDLFVDGAVGIAKIFGVSDRVIGITVIAIGTSLPELVTSIIAALNKKTDIAIGNILGSNIMNVLAIIGVTAIVKPIPVSQLFLTNDFMWMLGMTILLLPMLLTRFTISRWEGFLLFLLYCAYIYFIL